MQVLKLPEVCRKVGLSRAPVYKMVSEGKFPAPIKLGARASGWVDTEIDAWIEQRVVERDAGGAK
jgi:prophage regulatory protein